MTTARGIGEGPVAAWSDAVSTSMNDTEQLIALVHACGIRSGADPAGSRNDCPFCDDRIELCRAWLAGFSLGRSVLVAKGGSPEDR